MPSRMHSESVPPGAVAWTNLSIGARVVRGTTVQARLSAGPERYTLPTSIVGGTKSAAVTLLHPLPLATTYRPAYNETVPNDHVVSVTPTPGTAMRRDQQVVVVVSKGPETLRRAQGHGHARRPRAGGCCTRANLKDHDHPEVQQLRRQGLGGQRAALVGASSCAATRSRSSCRRARTTCRRVPKGDRPVGARRDAERLKQAGFAVDVKVYFGGALGLIAAGRSPTPTHAACRARFDRPDRRGLACGRLADFQFTEGGTSWSS